MNETSTASIDGARTGLLGDGGLPLVIEPERGAGRSAEELAGWMRRNRALAEERLTKHGALLLRGWEVDTPEAFERVVRTLAAELKKDYLGTSPRNALTEYVFNASELPGFYPIPQHCEMSFLARPPARLFFFCLVPPSGPGGETPLADMRRVYRDLDPGVRERFVARGVRIIRNYGGPGGQGRLDLWQLKPWHEMFGTTDRAVVEEKCRAAGFEHSWLPGDRLRLVSTQPATRAHPATGEIAWFNHVQVFHLASAAAEYRRIAGRMPGWRYRLLGRVASVGALVKRLRHGIDEQALHCTFGDGSPISDEDVEEVLDAIWKNLVTFRWRRGDVILIDNFATSHGRMPYRGPRHIAVCWE